MTAEPLTPASASAETAAVVPDSERGLLVAMAIMVVLGMAAMLLLL